jgi:alkyl sulfatase BDS1-like metallo-beta-lactamase superfamily hydrolase
MGALTAEHIFDLLGVRLRAEDVADLSAVAAFNFSDTGEQWIVELSNRALSAIRGVAESPDVTLDLPLTALIEALVTPASFVESIGNGTIAVTGDLGAVALILGHLDTFVGGFPIVEP